jgi:ribosomal protein S18 acetylase RimI-like enzyme
VLWLDVRGDAMPEIHAELERRALARRAPEGVVRAMAAEQDAVLAALLSERGYRRIRSSYRMGIDLAGQVFSPVWPSGALVRTAVEGVDEPLLHRLGDESFADHWGHTTTPYEEWLHWLRSMGVGDPSLWFIAEVEGAPAGVAICRPFDHGDPDCGWVSVLGVLRTHRRAGLGTALLTHSFGELQRRGRLRVELGVDAESTTGAVGLYERAGMRVLWRWDIWERGG